MQAWLLEGEEATGMSAASEPLLGGGSIRSHARFGTSFEHPSWIFDELPKATVVSVSRPDTQDISPVLLSYTIDFKYKEFEWRLLKKASQVLNLHFALKRGEIIEDTLEQQEQVKEWFYGLGIVDHEESMQDADEPDDGVVLVLEEGSVEIRYVPCIAGQQAIEDKAKDAMQNYLNHLLGNLDIVNSREVCKFLEVSKLSFSLECGPKLKEGYIMVKHPHNTCKDDANVWAVLKPGFLALLEDPFDTKLVEILVFYVPSPSHESGGSQGYLANQIKESNCLHYAFQVSCGCRTVEFRAKSSDKVQEWVSAINDAAVSPLEGWGHPHRYGSFAPPRGLIDDGSRAQWFIDGQAAFEAIASAIANAKSEIFITGWWLWPEYYLRRPFQSNSVSRLDLLLEAKAKEGVQIYVILFKEISIAMKTNSLYTEKRLRSLHENLRVLRHPDHLSSGVYYWSHHEKLVIVDNQICFIGGLDFCFGRYDNIEHTLGDCPPHIWPGKYYYNPRESEPNCYEDTMKDEVDRRKCPRMPWHDVHCALWGPACRDAARHFVQRWNHAKRNKAANEQTIPLLTPQQPIVPPHYMGRSGEIGIESKNAEENQKDIRKNSLSSSSPLQIGPLTASSCQIIRSVSQWSAGASQPEESIHNAYCSLIEKAQHFVYIENQYFISGLCGDDTIQNRVLDALYNRILRAHREQKCFRVIILMPLVPEFQGGLDDGGAATVRAIMHWQFRTISWDKTSILYNLNALLGPKTHNYISFYALRTYGRLFEGGPLATNQVYVHSKVMIVDDRAAFIGSSNINDRSLLGSRDSEIGVFIEDKDFIESSMNGVSWKAGKFAYSLRCSLWLEHLGLDAGEISKISDPAAETTYRDLWMEIAKENTMIYQEVFACLPNDLIQSRATLRQGANFKKEKFGDTTVDLGIAPEKVACCENGETKVIDPMERLKSIRGHLVCYPLKFLCQEDLRPSFNQVEFYASPQVFQ